MAPPRVSVIVPVFNAGRWLGQALASVAAQTYRDFEVVLVDDGSTDPATIALLDAAAIEPGITLHRTPNRGPAAARNLAIEHARGHYVVPLDADDWLEPAFLEKTLAVLEAVPDVGICYTWVGLTGGHYGVWRTGGFSVDELLSRCTVHVTALYRRRVWEDVGGYDPRFVEGWEDWDFWLGAATRGWTARCVPEVLAHYRRSANSRELRARAPGVGTRLMHELVGKHRSLYETRLDDAMSGLYEQYAAVCLALERAYDHPAARAFLWLRGLVGRGAAR